MGGQIADAQRIYVHQAGERGGKIQRFLENGLRPDGRLQRLPEATGKAQGKKQMQAQQMEAPLDR